MSAPVFTLGVEEEYQIVDPNSREMKAHITEMLATGDTMVLAEEIKAELHQSMVEVGTKVCTTPAQIKDELIRLRGGVMKLAATNGLVIVAAGSHPFSSWVEQEITPFDRYIGVQQDMQMLARQLLIMGTHVHIGIDDREFLVDAMNVSRYFLPHILCLTTSSPFWMGHETGLKSYRSVIFRNFPRTGIPPVLGSAAEYDRLVNTLVDTRSIPNASKIWWDARPNARYPTLEFRICDVATRVDEAVCIAAIFQALVYKLWKLRRDNMTFRVYPSDLVEENKWRAARYGLDGNLIDWGKRAELPARDLIRELVGWFLDDVVDELGSREHVEYAYTILDEGTSADRQLATYRRTGNLNDVVDQLVAETAEGVM